MHATTIRDYVYSSETQRRDQFTLKNILGMDDPKQKSNFISHNSERLIRTAPRPHTIHSQRLKIKFDGERNFNKNMTQMKVQQHGSTVKFYRSNSMTGGKSTSHHDKLKMKKALGKINLLAQNNTLGVEQEQQIQTIFNFLHCLADTDNHYQLAFSYLCQRLKALVYADNQSSYRQKIKQIADPTNNKLLINFVYRPLGRTTYQSICSQLLEITAHSSKKIKQLEQKASMTTDQLQEVIMDKQKTIIRLKQQLKYYSEHPSQDLYPYIKKLQRQDHEKQQEIDQLVSLKDQNQYKIQIFENTIMLLSEQIETLKSKIYQFELADLSKTKEVEKSSQLREFENNIQNLQDMLEKSKLKMEGMKQQFDKVKQYNQQLISERSVLAKRAAVGYAQLTPRPQYNQIFQASGLKLEQFQQSAKRKPTTEQIVSNLSEIVKLVPKQQIRNYFKKKIKQKVQEQQITKDVMNHIKKTKQQINITKISADNVKKQYNRQMNQLSSLEKTQTKK